MWSETDIIGRFSFDVVSFSHNLVLRGRYSQLMWFSPRAINNRDQITGSLYPTPAGGSHAFLYNGGKTFDLGTLGLNTGGYDSVGTAINDQGQVVGYSNVFTVPINRGSTHAFLYSGGGCETSTL